MHINDDHLYHGAALAQIAEHPRFTAINSLVVGGKTSRSAYKINSDIAVYLKYATKTTARFKEYVFTFSRDHLAELSKIALQNNQAFVALICVKDREVCCLTLGELNALLAARTKALVKLGKTEDTLTVLVTVPKGKSLRVYVNEPGVKKTVLGKEKIVSRSNFPDAIF